jgi:hypothetical protein
MDYQPWISAAHPQKLQEQVKYRYVQNCLLKLLPGRGIFASCFVTVIFVSFAKSHFFLTPRRKVAKLICCSKNKPFLKNNRHMEIPRPA